MLVVSDASPINILIRLDLIHLLPQLYQTVVVPTAVGQELSDPRAPHPIREFMHSLPEWVTIRAPLHISDFAGLGPGETEAICLGREIKADLLLVDDRRARRIAVQQGLRITGTLGILESAAESNLVDLAKVVEQLKTTDFKIDPNLLDESLQRHFDNRHRPAES